MPETRNQIGEERMSKLLRANVATLDESKFGIGDLDLVVKHHFKFLQDLATD